MIRGPGIKENSNQKSAAVITLDIAPTLIEIAGLNPEDYGMDGISLWNTLQSNEQDQEPNRQFFIEYHGEGSLGNDKGCPNTEGMAFCQVDWGCKCQDSLNNTYTCVRTLTTSDNSILCQFEDDEAGILGRVASGRIAGSCEVPADCRCM